MMVSRQLSGGSTQISGFGVPFRGRLSNGGSPYGASRCAKYFLLTRKRTVYAGFQCCQVTASCGPRPRRGRRSGLARNLGSSRVMCATTRAICGVCAHQRCVVLGGFSAPLCLRASALCGPIADCVCGEPTRGAHLDGLLRGGKRGGTGCVYGSRAVCAACPSGRAPLRWWAERHGLCARFAGCACGGVVHTNGARRSRPPYKL